MTDAAHVHLERRDHQATIILDRPEKRNALTRPMYRQIAAWCHELAEDPDIKVVVLASSDPRAFSAGADLGAVSDTADRVADSDEHIRTVRAAESAVAELPKPTVVVVEGYCIGGGLGLALACDLRFASASSSFSVTAVALGGVYGLESTARLVDRVGLSRTALMLFGGQPVEGGRAEAWGLVDVLARDTAGLERAVADFVGSLQDIPLRSLEATKLLLDRVRHGQRRDDEQSAAIRRGVLAGQAFADGASRFRRP